MLAKLRTHYHTFMPPARRALLTDAGLLVMRLAIGGFMAFGHGWGKLVGFAEKSATFPDPLHLGSSAVSLALVVFAEVACSLLLVAGLFTRLAAIPLAFTMMVAAFVIHGSDPFATKEKALLFLIAYLMLLLTGPGRWSLDHLLVGSPKPPPSA